MSEGEEDELSLWTVYLRVTRDTGRLCGVCLRGEEQACLVRPSAVLELVQIQAFKIFEPLDAYMPWVCAMCEHGARHALRVHRALRVTALVRRLFAQLPQIDDHRKNPKLTALYKSTSWRECESLLRTRDSPSLVRTETLVVDTTRDDNVSTSNRRLQDAETSPSTIETVVLDDDDPPPLTPRPPVTPRPPGPPGIILQDDSVLILIDNNIRQDKIVEEVVKNDRPKRKRVDPPGTNIVPGFNIVPGHFVLGANVESGVKPPGINGLQRVNGQSGCNVPSVVSGPPAPGESDPLGGAGDQFVVSIEDIRSMIAQDEDEDEDEEATCEKDASESAATRESGTQTRTHTRHGSGGGGGSGSGSGSRRAVPNGHKIDWEDKIPMDVISFMDATDPNAAELIVPDQRRVPPVPPAGRGHMQPPGGSCAPPGSHTNPPRAVLALFTPVIDLC